MMPILYQLKHNLVEHQAIITKEIGYSNYESNLNCDLLHHLFNNKLYLNTIITFLIISMLFSSIVLFKNQFYIQNHFNFTDSRGPPYLIF